jgi:hypothetical protein
VCYVVVVFQNYFSIKNIYKNIFLKKKLFLILAYQNDLKTQKNINLKYNLQKKHSFKTQKQTG